MEWQREDSPLENFQKIGDIGQQGHAQRYE